MVACCSCECQGTLHSIFPPSLKQHPDSPNKNSPWWFLWLIILLQNTHILLPAFLLKQPPSNTIPPFLMHLCCQSLQAWNQVMLVFVEIILTTGDTGRPPVRNATVFALETTLSPAVGMAESFFLTVSIEAASVFPKGEVSHVQQIREKAQKHWGLLHTKQQNTSIWYKIKLLSISAWNSHPLIMWNSTSKKRCLLMLQRFSRFPQKWY